MRLLHTMLRVGNLERSLAFYQDVLDMQLLRKQDYPEGRFTLAFIGYGDEANHTVIELTHNWTPRSMSWATPMAILPWKQKIFTPPATPFEPLAAPSLASRAQSRVAPQRSPSWSTRMVTRSNSSTRNMQAWGSAPNPSTIVSLCIMALLQSGLGPLILMASAAAYS